MCVARWDRAAQARGDSVEAHLQRSMAADGCFQMIIHRRNWLAAHSLS